MHYYENWQCGKCGKYNQDSNERCIWCADSIAEIKVPRWKRNRVLSQHPKVSHKGTVHGVHASGGPGDGSLWGFYTFCGLEVKDDQHNSDWRETDEATTCKNCLRIAASKTFK
jgi:hypothetical protein